MQEYPSHNLSSSTYMTDWRITAATKSYKQSLSSTESIDPPSIGFLKPATGVGLAEVLKQNNTIIQLLVSISERLEDVQTDLSNLKKEAARKGKAQVPEKLDPLLEEIQKKLEGFHIGEPKPPRKKTPFFVFSDPLKIYEAEKQR